MTQAQERPITDERELLADQISHWLSVYKRAIRQEDEITEGVALGNVEYYTQKLLKEDNMQA